VDELAIRTNAKPSLFRTPDGQNYAVIFCLVSSLFLLWGLCNGMIDVMDKHFQDRLHLSKAESAWVQFAHYLGYFLMAIPAGVLARRFGYKGAIVCGLLLVAAGGFWFVAATHIALFWAFLFGVCVIAMGLTILETVANPYTTVLGAKQFSAARINLAQSFNGVGWILGPTVGGAFFYSSGGLKVSQERLYIPYAVIAVIVLAMAGVFLLAHVPELSAEEKRHPSASQTPGVPHSIWTQPHFVGAVLAQFLYVAAQAGIFSFFINYMVSEVPALPGRIAESWALRGGSVLRENAYYLNEQGASRLQGMVAFLLFCVGRFTGAAILRKVQAHRMLSTYAVVNVFLCGVVALKLGWISVSCVFLSFFFMSIMFPTIFALGLQGLGAQAKRASAFIVMAIMGGAIMPKLMGYVGDVYDMSTAFLVPLACFVPICIYGHLWPQLSQANRSTMRRDAM
jgi:MFS transporter, FHS family, L-fucose permease